MAVHEIIGLFLALVALAGLSMCIVNGGQTAAVVGSLANGFATDVQAATLSSGKAA